MLELNPVKDNFTVSLPENLLMDEVVNELSKILQGRHYVHDNLMDFYTEALQSVTVPEFIADLVKITGKNYQLNKRPATNDLFRIGDFAITLNFRILNAHWNYWATRVSFFKWIKNEEKLLNDNMGDCILRFHSNDSLFSINLKFKKCVMVGNEGQEFSYADNEINNAQYFSIALVFDDMDLEVVLKEFDNVKQDGSANAGSGGTID